MRYFLITLLSFLSVALIDQNPYALVGDVGGCTIGVFSGRVTSDGRPIIWKNRDIGEAVQKYCYFDPIYTPHGNTYAYVGNVNSADTTRVYMGLNEAGFAIMNANTYNLDDSLSRGIDDGAFIKFALEQCQTLADFEDLLDQTSDIGRKDCWNIGVMDAAGGAAMYECSNRSYVKYDADDTLNGGHGYIIRATFSFSGGDSLDGLTRFKRASQLVINRLRVQPIDVRFIFQTLARDLANPIADPYPLPYDGIQDGRPAGFILARNVTINRNISRSVAVMRGVRYGENTSLATLYAMIGPPVLSVAYPMWVRAGCSPQALNMGVQVPMYVQIGRRLPQLYPLHDGNLYLDSRYLCGKDSVGLFAYTLPLENSVLDAVEDYLSMWENQIPAPAVVEFVQDSIADTIIRAYTRFPTQFPQMAQENEKPETAFAGYPNPFNAYTTIQLSGFIDSEPVDVAIYNVLGQRVRQIQIPEGKDRHISWNGRDDIGNPLASGVYLIRAISPSRTAATKSLLIK
jgi:hypothetical protein